MNTCTSKWTSVACLLTCKLTNLGVIAYRTVTSTFGQGSGPVFLTNLGCRGSENSLLSCSKMVFVGTYCTHGRDVGVKCERKYSYQPKKRSLMIQL